MKAHIHIAINTLRQAIDAADGPVFTDADRGRVLRRFTELLAAMDESDRQFEARIVEAKKFREAERRRIHKEELFRDFGEWGSKDDR